MALAVRFAGTGVRYPRRWRTMIAAAVVVAAIGSVALAGHLVEQSARMRSQPTQILAGAPCTAGQLTFGFVGGGVGGGAGFGASHRVIRAESGWVNSVPAGDIRLSAQASPSSAPGSGSWAVVGLGGDSRDDPTGPYGLCPSAQEVVPAFWRVTVANATRDVANYDPTAQTSAITGCHANFLNVFVIAQP